MLDIKPNCELCNKNLAANSTEAFICTYECTFCRDCVNSILNNVCPNCGGNLCSRPIRPSKEYRAGVSLIQQPSSDKRVNTSYSEQEIQDFVKPIKHISPDKR